MIILWGHWCLAIAGLWFKWRIGTSDNPKVFNENLLGWVTWGTHTVGAVGVGNAAGKEHKWEPWTGTSACGLILASIRLELLLLFSYLDSWAEHTSENVNPLHPYYVTKWSVSLLQMQSGSVADQTNEFKRIISKQYSEMGKVRSFANNNLKKGI